MLVVAQLNEIETCFLTSVIIVTNVQHWMGVTSI